MIQQSSIIIANELSTDNIECNWSILNQLILSPPYMWIALDILGGSEQEEEVIMGQVSS